MIGDYLLLAPVLHAGARERSVVLPDGVWHDYWSIQTWTGGARVTVPAPLDRVPLFVRGGAILPMVPPAACTADTAGFDEVELHLWPPFGGSYLLREDDGLTRAYQRGEAATTCIEVEQLADRVDVRVSPPDGPLPRDGNPTSLDDRAAPRSGAAPPLAAGRATGLPRRAGRV